MSAIISNPSKIQIPVIYPSTLTEEQRSIIKQCFAYYAERFDNDIDDSLAEGHIDAFMWLFGEDFFNVE